MSKLVNTPVAPAPSRTFQTTVLPTTVVTKLFGDVTPEREAKERKEAAYRCDQLNPLPPKVERVPARRQRPSEDDVLDTVDLWVDPEERGI